VPYVAPHIYLSTPGRAGEPVRLPAPLPGVGLSRPRGTSVARTLAGNAVVHRQASQTRREWSYTWSQLDRSEMTVLDELASGQRGRGPWLLTDPAQTNQLSPNQASGTALRRDTTGFRVGETSGETIQSWASAAHRGQAGLMWTVPAAVTDGTLRLDADRVFWIAQVVHPEHLPMTFSCWVYCESAIQVGTTIQWAEPTGSPIGTDVVSSNTTLTPNTWTRLVQTATPPSNAVWVRPWVRVVGASVSAETDIYLDEFQLQHGSVTDWAPGAGAPAVVILDPETTSRNYGLWEDAWTLAEVA
jgi:hypothetical protein